MWEFIYKYIHVDFFIIQRLNIFKNIITYVGRVVKGLKKNLKEGEWK